MIDLSHFLFIIFQSFLFIFLIFPTFFLTLPFTTFLLFNFISVFIFRDFGNFSDLFNCLVFIRTCSYFKLIGAFTSLFLLISRFWYFLYIITINRYLLNQNIHFFIHGLHNRHLSLRCGRWFGHMSLSFLHIFILLKIIVIVIFCILGYIIYNLGAWRLRQIY